VLTVAAVVVTRNRPALLKRCLAAIDGQTYPAKHLVVVDNASDQPTRDLLAAEVARRDTTFHMIRSEENTGGAGGFHIGMRACLSLPCTHLWLMDDDCEPDRKALEELVAAMSVVGEDAVLGGNVFDLNGESINVQSVAQRIGANGVAQYPLHLADGLCEMGALTFVSFLVPVKLVWKVGLPFKEFFIWGDDLEYSLRLARVTRIYQVGKSKVTHMKSGDASLNIAHERDNDKIWQYRLAYRNRLFIIQKYDGVISTQTARFIFRSFRDIFLSIRSGTSVLMKCKTILYGAFSGIVFSAKMAKKDGSIVPDEIVAGAKEPERQNVA
jgi:rhamnopyranosyl-N-acetylglucosaminyl-diphospho-decaprenol beta-1,3/1,4-galactofuranosyltransferase